MSGRKGGRPKSPIPKKKKDVYLSIPLIAEVEMLLTDPSRQRWTVKHGAWSGLVEALLNQWVEEQRKNPLPQGEPDAEL